VKMGTDGLLTSVPDFHVSLLTLSESVVFFLFLSFSLFLSPLPALSNDGFTLLDEGPRPAPSSLSAKKVV
jgi:hypothetical protein